MRWAVVLLVGCSSITSAPTFDEVPLAPLQLSVETLPNADNGFITRDAVVRVVMDDYPDPDTAVFPLVLLRSGTASFDVTIHVDLVGKAIELRPRSLLQAQTDYEIVVDKTVRSLSGRTVGTNGAQTLHVGNDLSPSPSPSPAAVWDSTVDCPSDGNVRCVLQTCAPACHAPMGCSLNARNATIALDLTADLPTDPNTGLIGVPSQLTTGTDHTLLRVQPNDGARSMLLRKLLGGDPHAESKDPPTANLAVPGRRMPLHEEACQGLGTPDYWTDDQIRLIQDWIDGGAVVK